MFLFQFPICIEQDRVVSFSDAEATMRLNTRLLVLNFLNKTKFRRCMHELSPFVDSKEVRQSAVYTWQENYNWFSNRVSAYIWNIACYREPSSCTETLLHRSIIKYLISALNCVFFWPIVTLKRPVRSSFYGTAHIRTLYFPVSQLSSCPQP